MHASTSSAGPRGAGEEKRGIAGGEDEDDDDDSDDGDGGCCCCCDGRGISKKYHKKTEKKWKIGRELKIRQTRTHAEVGMEGNEKSKRRQSLSHSNT